MEKIKFRQPLDLAMREMELIKRLIIITSKDDSTPADFVICLEPTRDLKLILPKLKKMLPIKFWWTHESFLKKEQPKSFKLTQGNEVFDYSHQIDALKIQVIDSVNNFFGKILSKHNLNLPKYLIFDDVQVPNFNSGFPMNGQVLRNWNAIRFYPESFEIGKYRSKENSKFSESVDHFLGVLIHEYSHFLDPVFLSQWEANFGWRTLDEPILLSKNWLKMKECVEPQKCISDYALYHPQEDFCESMVGLLLSPEHLKAVSPEKFSFLTQVITGFELLPSKIQSDIQNNKLPTLPEKITVRVEPSKFKRMRIQ